MHQCKTLCDKTCCGACPHFPGVLLERDQPDSPCLRDER